MPFSWRAEDPQRDQQALTVKCPVCGAEVGEPCTTLMQRQLMRQPHASRIKKSRK